MRQVSDLFVAKACNPYEIAHYEDNPGYRIPEYQRPYDWSKENIDRLMMDIFSGFERLSHGTGANAFTFLGTLILVKDPKQEPKFKGKSLSIVDGQQRLTTLTLLACALIERLRVLRKDIPKISKRIDSWIDIEQKDLEENLAECVFGGQKVGNREYYPFPRIVRSEDHRADNHKDREIKSGVAKFLVAFEEFIRYESEIAFQIPVLDETREAKKIIDNFCTIREYCEHLNDKKWYEDNDCKLVSPESFSYGGYTKLWGKLRDSFGDDDPSSELSKINNHAQTKVHSYFRTLMLAAYFCKCIAVTIVVTEDEDAAFDIFDALNTTGEPLTALETLKPKVIQTENKRQDGKYEGSNCEIAFREIDETMEKDHPGTKEKQDETKELVITFCLYFEGLQISRELSIQRKELRQLFDKSCEKTANGSEKFMRALANISRYRSTYWITKNNRPIDVHHPNAKEADEIKFLCAFIREMKATRTLPILARYWIDGEDKRDFGDYIEVLRAVSAFLAIRRSATGTTDGIDTCFRQIMEHGDSNKKFGLCVGPSFERSILSPNALKKALFSKLSSSKVKFTSKEKWMDYVVDTPIYDRSAPLARFLLFCATHHAAPDTKHPGLLTRESISPNGSYMSFMQWDSEDYRSVEHVAPNADKPEGWDGGIYANARLRGTLGNLVLLPTKENSAIGNVPWSKKKIFYTALTREKTTDREAAIESAKREGMRFSTKTEKMLKNGKHFSMLDGIETVEEWNANFIEKRSKRLAGLAWDQLWPWLEPKD